MYVVSSVLYTLSFYCFHYTVKLLKSKKFKYGTAYSSAFNLNSIQKAIWFAASQELQCNKRHCQWYTAM